MRIFLLPPAHGLWLGRHQCHIKDGWRKHPTKWVPGGFVTTYEFSFQHAQTLTTC